MKICTISLLWHKADDISETTETFSLDIETCNLKWKVLFLHILPHALEFSALRGPACIKYVS